MRPFLRIYIAGLFLLGASPLWAQQTTNLSKDFDTYLHLRERFLEHFIIVGEGPGKSLPARLYNPHFTRWGNVSNHKTGSKGHVRWNDATFYLGDYLAVLASEHKLFKTNGLPTKATARELYCALKAYSRLDSLAEHHLFNVSGKDDGYEANGFFLRDDITEQFVAQNFYRIGFYSSMTHAKEPFYNVVSQDQIIGLLFGLTCVSEFCDEELQYQDVNLPQFARSLADQMLRYLKRCNWVLVDPVNGEKVPRGANAFFQSFALAKTGKRITGKKYGDFWSGTASRFFWKLAQRPFRSLSEDKVEKNRKRLIYGDVNNGMMLRLAASGSSWRRSKIMVNAFAAKMEVFALAHAALNDYKPSISRKHFSRLLNAMTKEGPYSYGKGNNAPGGWASPNRWSHPSHRYEGAEEGSHQAGQYSGLDYMLFHNLYHLAYEIPLKNRRK